MKRDFTLTLQTSLAMLSTSLIGALLIVFLNASLVTAQVAATASLVGRVADSSDAVLPSATVTITNIETGFTKQFVTGDDGTFSFTSVPIGKYRLNAEAAGFARYEQNGIVLNVNATPNIGVVLQVGAVDAQVTVQADAAMVDTQSGTLKQVINTRYIEDLPLNGRNAATLVRMVPGTVTGVGTTTAGYANTSETQAISVNGTRGNEVRYNLDGASHMDNITNLNAIYPNPDALAEFSVQTSNYSAQYGNAAGAVVNVVTKSGTNSFHGTAFDFLRNGVLNARNFFAPQRDNLKRNQFGATLGGPVVKNTIFFFASYQGTEIRSTSFANTAFVPSRQQREGDFSRSTRPITDPLTNRPFPGNRIPADRISPISSELLKKVPFTDDPTGRLLYARPESVGNHQWLAKADYNRGRHLMSGSFFAVRYTDPGWDGDGTLLTARIGQRQTTDSVKFQYTFAASPNLINTFIASTLFMDSRNTRTSRYTIRDFGDARIAMPKDEFAELELSVSGYGGWGGVSNSPPGQWTRAVVEFSDALNYTFGKHTLQVGGEVMPFTKFDSTTGFQTSGNFSFSGQITGDGLADLLLGRVATFLQTAGKFKQTRGKQISLYAEDKYNITPTLTLTYGLRWDPFYPFRDVLGQVAGYRPGARSERFINAPVGAIFAGDPGFPEEGMNSDVNNFAPRFGFAWSALRGDRPTTLRGGYGVFYVRPFLRLYNNFVETAPFSPSVTLRNVDLADPYGSARVENQFPPFAPLPLDRDSRFVLPTNYAFFKEDWRVGYLQAWNLTLEHEPLKDVLLRLAYVGNKGTHLQSFRELNPATYGPGATLANTNARRSLAPAYASLVEMVDDGYSNYHSLQFTTEKRFSNNFSLLAFYTFSKAIDNESVNAQFTLSNPNPFDSGFNRGLADYDVPHNFRITGVYNLPQFRRLPSLLRQIIGGWSMTEILDWRSGTPFTLRSGRDNSFSGVGQDRADLISDPVLSRNRSREQTINQYFNADAATINAVGTFGNSPRNFLRTVPYLNVDASIHKNFALTEAVRLQLRGEFFNLFNNVQLGQPGTNVSDRSTFGRITSAGNPRIIQFGVKFIF